MLRIVFALTLMIISLPVAAQFNPPNPDEPGTPVFRYHVRTMCEHENIGWTSGDGDYEPGSDVWISTSLYSNAYTFSHWSWSINGQEYTSEEQYFYYTMTEQDVTFTAHYTFTPDNPEEPTTVLKSRVYFSSVPEGIASFNHSSGERLEVGSSQYIDVYPNQGYVFQGWYKGTECISKNKDFYYTIPANESHLVAHFVYNPTNPANPEDDGTLRDPDAFIPGDVNGDGNILLNDATMIINYVIGKPQSNFNEDAADFNGDGKILLNDATMIINKIIGK